MSNTSKLPPNYFLYPEFLAFVFLPVTWFLLPMAAYYPEILVAYLPSGAIFNYSNVILTAQVNCTFDLR